MLTFLKVRLEFVKEQKKLRKLVIKHQYNYF